MVTATLSGPSAFTTTVNVTTTNGTALSASEYAATSTTVTFAPGLTQATATIPITDDTVYEGNETFTAGLSGPVNATLGAPSAAVVTIVDDETQSAVALSTGTYSIAEQGGPAVVTATLSGASAFTTTVSG